MPFRADLWPGGGCTQVQSLLQMDYVQRYEPLAKRLCEEMKADDAFFK